MFKREAALAAITAALAVGAFSGPLAPPASGGQRCASLEPSWYGNVRVNRIPCSKAQRMISRSIDGKKRWKGIGWYMVHEGDILPLGNAKLWPGKGNGYIRFVQGSGD